MLILSFEYFSSVLELLNGAPYVQAHFEDMSLGHPFVSFTVFKSSCWSAARWSLGCYNTSLVADHDH